MKLCDDDGLFDHCRRTHPLNYVHLYSEIYGFGQPSYTCVYIYLQSHLHVCLPEATIEKEKEDIIFYIYTHTCSELMHTLQARRKGIYARTHLSYLWHSRSEKMA